MATRYDYGGCCDRLKTVIDAAGFQTEFAYDHVGNRSEVRDALAHVTKTLYDGRNRLIEVRNHLGERTTVLIDDDLTDGAGIDGDANPVVQAVIASLGYVAGVADGSAIATTDATRSARVIEFRDGLGRPVARIDALDHVTRWRYDIVRGDGTVEMQVEDALGHITATRVDGLGRSVVLIDAEGQETRQGFDANGNQLSGLRHVGAELIGWTASYDARNRMDARSDTRAVDRGTVRWTYDPAGNRTSEESADGKVESYDYDLRNRRTAVRDRLGGTTRFGYDGAGNLLWISDAENEGRSGAAQDQGRTQYAYDVRLLLTAEALPMGQRGRTLRRYSYDGARRLSQREVGRLSGAFGAEAVFAGAVTRTSYAYDAANRLTVRSYGDGRDDRFGYDAAGRLTEAVSGRYGNRVVRTYDAAGRLTAEHLAITAGVGVLGGSVVPAQYTVRYAYDVDGQVVTLTYPDGRLVHRAYTPRHELATVALSGVGQVAVRSYDDAGRLIETRAGNGVVETRSYVVGDALVASIAATAPGATPDAARVPVTQFGYTYDVERRKTAETDGLQAARSQTFGYDDAGRLTSWQQGATQQAWDLSLVGDWRSTTVDGVTQPRQHTAVHEATRVGDRALGYDAKGNLVLDERRQILLWDDENRLQAALNLGGAPTAAATYAYDALGRRVSTTIGHQRTDWVSAGAQVVQAYPQRAVVPLRDLAQEGTAGALHQEPPSGGLLRPARGQPVIRVNAQPAYEAIPRGYLADKGRTFGVRTSGQRYGWSTERSSSALVRGVLADAAWDTLIPLGGATWRIRLPVGHYAVAVVAGDAASVARRNDLVLNGMITLTDPDQPAATPGYPRGDFDGWVRSVEIIADPAAGAGFGFLTLAAGPEAVDPTLCVMEIGPRSATAAAAEALAADAAPRLAAAVEAQTNATVTGAQARQGVRTFVYGAYVDEVVAYQTVAGGVVARYYPHYNSLYSVAALTDGTTGQVVERYTYNAYGKQKITDASGNVARAKSSVGWDRGFTGYITDNETGLLHARARQYSPTLGRFISRDPYQAGVSLGGYHDGMSQYGAYFVPNKLDPLGLWEWGCKESCEFQAQRKMNNGGLYQHQWDNAIRECKSFQGSAECKNADGGGGPFDCNKDCDSQCPKGGDGIMQFRCREKCMNWKMQNCSDYGCLSSVVDPYRKFLQNMGWSDGPGVTNDKYQHCLSSCQISRGCNIPLSRLLGIMKEISDSIRPGEGWSNEDMDANRYGIECSRDKSVSCECCCAKKYGGPDD